MDASADALSNPQVAGAGVREVPVTIPLRRLTYHPVPAIGASGNARQQVGTVKGAPDADDFGFTDRLDAVEQILLNDRFVSLFFHHPDLFRIGQTCLLAAPVGFIGAPV